MARKTRTRRIDRGPKPSRHGRSSLDRRDAIAIGSLVAAGFLAFAPVLDYPFLNWDDHAYVSENPLIRSMAPGDLARLFAPSAIVVANWAPITILSYATDHAAFGLDPGAFHRTNLLLHLVSGVLVFFLFRQLAGGRAAAWLAALIFLLHPIQIESVAWIAERKNVLSLPLALATFLIARDMHGPARRHAIALILFALALMAKATVVVLPLLLIAAWTLLDREPARAAWRRAVPYLAMSLAAGIATLAAQGGAGGIKPYYGGDPILTAATMVRVVWLELFLFVDPRRLAAIYRPPIASSALEPSVLVAALALVVLAWLLWRLRTRAPRVTFLATWYAIALLPVLNLVPLPHLMADRFLYLGSIGIAGLVSLGISAAAGRIFEDRTGGRHASLAVIGAGCVLGGACFLATRTHLPTWSDSERLWRETLRRTPDAEVAHGNLGEVLAARGSDLEALAHYRRAVELRPDYDEARMNLANALARLGRAAEAESVYATARARTPDDPELLYNLGTARLTAGDLAGARAAFEEAVRLNPREARAQNNLAVIAYEEGNLDEALARFDASIAVDPANAEAHSNRGLVLGRLGRQREALESIRRAIEIRPDYPQAHFNLGIALLAAGDIEGARRAFARAVELDPALAGRVPPPARSGP